MDKERAIDIYEDMDRKRFFQNGLKKRRFRRKADIFVYIGKKVFSFTRNIDIYEDMRNKRFFSKYFQKTCFTPKC